MKAKLKPNAEAWRLHGTHGLWVEIREGCGTSNRMVAGCLSTVDAEHIVNMHNTLLERTPSHEAAGDNSAPECVRELRAENENLRDALERIINRENRVPGLQPGMYGHAAAIAEMALAGRERHNDKVSQAAGGKTK